MRRNAKLQLLDAAAGDVEMPAKLGERRMMEMEVSLAWQKHLDCPAVVKFDVIAIKAGCVLVWRLDDEQ